MIACRAVLPGGVEVGCLWAHHLPRAGERLLLAGDTGDAAEAHSVGRAGSRRSRLSTV